MKSKKIISAIMILVIIIIAIIITILVLLNNSSTNVTEEQIAGLPELDEELQETDIVLDTMQKVSVRSEYYVVKNCVKRFYSCSEKKDLYNLLDEEYKKYKGITSDNIEKAIENIEKIDSPNAEIHISNMYTIQKDTRLRIYLTDGVIINQSNNKKYDFSIIVNVDMTNKAFSLILEDYISSKIGKIDENSKIPYDFHQIEKNDFNGFTYDAIDDKTYLTDLFNNYKYNLLYNVGAVYNNLDKEYKERRFSTADKFKKFLEYNGRQSLEKINISKYQKIYKSGYSQFVCLDTNDRYMFINEKSPSEITYILDNHTIDTDEFKEKYDKLEENGKAKLNVDKIFDAINTFDYEYIYSKLDDNFKRNNYDSIDKLEKHMQEVFYNNNTIEYSNYTNEGNLHIFKVKITEKNNTKSKEKNVTIIMKLQENRNFVMSFSAE